MRLPFNLRFDYSADTARRDLRYVSESVVLGFMAGAGLLVAIGQVGNFIGVTKTGGASHSVLVRLWETLTQSGPYNLVAIGLGLGTLIAALLLRRVINKYKLPQMDMLVALIVASAVATYFGWSIPKPDGKAIISVVGTVPAALPSFHVPEINFEWVTRLAGSALAISFLGLLEALAVAKSIATQTRQPLDYNRQCMAEGLGNLVPADHIYAEKNERYSTTLNAFGHAYQLLHQEHKGEEREAVYYLV